MGYKLVVNLTDDEYKQIRKTYEKEKSKFKEDISFDEYLDKWVMFAIRTQIQFANLNENMSNFSSSLFDNLNFDNFKFGDSDINDLSNFVNSIFNSKSNEEETDKDIKDKSKNKNDNNKNIN